MEAHSSETIRLPSVRSLARGIQLFVAISVVAIAVGLWWKAPADARNLLGHLDWRFALALIPLVAVDYVVGGLRYRVLFNGRVLPWVSLWNCMRSNWANIFLGAATPFQTGGGPAQLYILWRCGAKISEGMLASLVNFAGTLIFFLVSSLVALILLPGNLFSPQVTGLIRGAFGVVVGVTALVIGVMIFPKAGVSVVRWVYDRILVRSRRLARTRADVLGRLEGGVERFGEALRHAIRRGRGELLLVVLLTLVLFFNKYTIGYVVIRALGQDVPYGLFLGLQCIQLGVIYFAPTPGASGVAELSSLWLMERVIPSGLLVVYTVLWRFLTTVLGAVIGGGILLFDLRKMGLEQTQASRRDALRGQQVPVATVLEPCYKGSNRNAGTVLEREELLAGNRSGSGLPPRDESGGQGWGPR